MQEVNFAAFGGTYTQQDNYSSNGIVRFINGTFNANNFNFNCDAWVANSGLVRAVQMGNGTWTINGLTNAWTAVASNLTLTASGSTIKLTSTASPTFTGGGLAYNNLYWSSTTSTGTIIITGANTFASLQSDNSTARMWQFPASTVTNIAPGGFRLAGKPGVLMSLTSSTGGTPATLSSGGKVMTNFLSIKDIAAAGSTKWCAGPASTNVSGNTGWIFGSTGCGAVYRPGRHPVWLLDPANDNQPMFLRRAG